MNDFALAVIDWQRRFGRHDLPWQGDNPYHIWLSEVMLQQTGVETVRGYFKRFIKQLPTLQALAQADEQTVLALWAGLGYYARARNLLKAARVVEMGHGGVLPSDPHLLATLPGIGPSTAGAITALAYDRPGVVLDGNIKRVLARTEGVDTPLKGATLRTLWQVAGRLTPATGCRAYVQGMMDLGATLCTRKNPACDRCPVSDRCEALKTDRVAALPVPVRRGALEQKVWWLLLSIRCDRIYLVRRASEGLWGGLWTPPLCDRSPGTVQGGLPAFDHTFTHFRLRLHPVFVPPDHSGEGMWFSLWDLPPLPAPLQRLLVSLRPEPPGSAQESSGR
jgi:A/G-specific adenine glycosylase